MKRLFAISVVMLLLAALCLQATPERDREYEEKRSEKAEKAAATFRKNIDAELATLNKHEWAGQYYYGDGLGASMSLMLAPKAGFLFEWHGCLGLYDRNYGAVSMEKGVIHLACTFPNMGNGFPGVAKELLPIAWEERMYLIPSNDIVGFCNKVNDGSEPRKDAHGWYLLRRGDEKKKVKGFPAIPAEFKAYLLSHPIDAEIVAVKEYKTRPSIVEWKFKDTPVVLNRGKKHGLLQGMKMFVTKPDNLVEEIQIKKVEEEQSEGVMTQMGENEKGPQVGWKLSTRCRWNP